MTDTQVEAPPPATHTAPRQRLGALVRTILGPLWTRTFRDPVVHGRLRLVGLSWGERQLARVGLVTLVLLLVSLLFVDVWRRGPLLDLTLNHQPLFVPEGLVPVTLAALFMALSLIVWGALDASPGVKLAVAATYVGTVSVLGSSFAYATNDSWILEHGTTIVRVAFAVTPLALVVSALSARSARTTRVLTPLLRALSLASFAVMLGTLLWVNVEFQDAGFSSGLQHLINGGFISLDGLLGPLVVVTAVAVVDFATDVSTSLAEPAAKAPSRLRNLVAAAVLAVAGLKLWFTVFSQLDFWSAYVARQPGTLLRTIGALALLLAACVLANRLAAPGTDDEVDEAKERITLAGAAVLSVTAMGAVVLLGVGLLILTITSDETIIHAADDFPVGTISTWVPMVASVVAVAAGMWLLRRSCGSSASRELGSGLFVVGVWNVQAWATLAADISVGLSDRTIDVSVTAGVLVWLAVRWRRLQTGEAALLLAVLLFSWLVMSRGDYISYLGGFLGLPAVVVVVFGVLYTLASGAAFASESSKRLPRESRTLMFTGYLLLSVTILHWLESVHTEQGSAADAVIGFHYLAIPMAAWLLARRIIPRSLAPQPSPAADDPAPASSDQL